MRLRIIRPAGETPDDQARTLPVTSRTAPFLVLNWIEKERTKTVEKLPKNSCYGKSRILIYPKSQN